MFSASTLFLTQQIIMHKCLNLILILCPEKCSAAVLPSFGTSDYLLINVKADAKPKSIPLMYHFIGQFFSMLNSFGSYITESPCFSFQRASRTASLISSQAGIVLNLRKNTNINQITSLVTRQNVLQP